MTRTVYPIVLIGMLLGNSIPGVSKDLGHEEAQRLQSSGEIVALEYVLEQARAQKPGRLLEVELERKRKKLIYEIEIVGKDGVVWEFEFDASNGELIKLKQDD